MTLDELRQIVRAWDREAGVSVSDHTTGVNVVVYSDSADKQYVYVRDPLHGPAALQRCIDRAAQRFVAHLHAEWERADRALREYERMVGK